jgi:hypothetical protein
MPETLNKSHFCAPKSAVFRCLDLLGKTIKSGEGFKIFSPKACDIKVWLISLNPGNGRHELSRAQQLMVY